METTFEGEYRPGGPGVSTMPIPVIGSGRISVGADGLTVVGARHHENLFLGLVVALSMITLLFFIGALANPDVIGTRVGGKGGMMFGTALALAVGGGATAILLRSRRKLVPWQFTVPWKSVRKLEVDGLDELVVTIKRMRPKGTLHFAPIGGAAKMLAGIESAKPR